MENSPPTITTGRSIFAIVGGGDGGTRLTVHIRRERTGDYRGNSSQFLRSSDAVTLTQIDDGKLLSLLQPEKRESDS